MKARRHNARAFDWGTKTNLTYFEDSSGIHKDCLNHFGLNMSPSRRERAQKEAGYLIDKFENAVEIGSLLYMDKIDIGLLLDFIHDCGEDGDIQMEGGGYKGGSKAIKEAGQNCLHSDRQIPCNGHQPSPT